MEIGAAALGTCSLMAWLCSTRAASGITLSRTVVLTRRMRRLTGESVLARLANISPSGITLGCAVCSGSCAETWRRRAMRWRSRLARMSSSPMVSGAPMAWRTDSASSVFGVWWLIFCTSAKVRARVRISAGSSRLMVFNSTGGLGACTPAASSAGLNCQFTSTTSKSGAGACVCGSAWWAGVVCGCAKSASGISCRARVASSSVITGNSASTALALRYSLSSNCR